MTRVSKRRIDKKSFRKIYKELIKLVDYVIPGVCNVKQASTVVDCSVDPYRIIRQGAVYV